MEEKLQEETGSFGVRTWPQQGSGLATHPNSARAQCECLVSFGDDGYWLATRPSIGRAAPVIREIREMGIELHPVIWADDLMVAVIAELVDEWDSLLEGAMQDIHSNSL